MISIGAVVRMIGGVKTAELRYWIEEGWIRPERDRGEYIFREIDVARARLIQELRRELAIDREAVPVVLNLLDQLYGMRRRLRAVNEAIAAQPPAVRRTLRSALRAAPKPKPRPAVKIKPRISS